MAESHRQGQHWSLPSRTQPGCRTCGNRVACDTLADLTDLTDTEPICPWGVAAGSHLQRFWAGRKERGILSFLSSFIPQKSMSEAQGQQ